MTKLKVFSNITILLMVLSFAKTQCNNYPDRNRTQKQESKILFSEKISVKVEYIKWKKLMILPKDMRDLYSIGMDEYLDLVQDIIKISDFEITDHLILSNNEDSETNDSDTFPEGYWFFVPPKDLTKYASELGQRGYSIEWDDSN